MSVPATLDSLEMDSTAPVCKKEPIKICLILNNDYYYRLSSEFCRVSIIKLCTSKLYFFNSKVPLNVVWID